MPKLAMEIIWETFEDTVHTCYLQNELHNIFNTSKFPNP